MDPEPGIAVTHGGEGEGEGGANPRGATDSELGNANTHLLQMEAPLNASVVQGVFLHFLHFLLYFNFSFVSI